MENKIDNVEVYEKKYECTAQLQNFRQDEYRIHSMRWKDEYGR